MNKRQADRLLNVAKALRESPNPNAFTMRCFIRGDGLLEWPDAIKEGWCGTPGCALGHYASRPDLQRAFTIVKVMGYCELIGYNLSFDGTDVWNYKEEAFLKYFGVNYHEANSLFSLDGCGNAKTPLAAAKYIEQFVARKLKAK